MNLTTQRALRDPHGLYPEYFDPGEECVRVSDGEYVMVLPAAVFDGLDEVALRSLFEARKQAVTVAGYAVVPTPLLDMATGTPIEVRATTPPSMCVTALGHELFLDVWNPLFPTRVLICATGQALVAVYGVASASPTRPALPADAHALAEVLVPTAAERITEEDIFQLTDSPR